MKKVIMTILLVCVAVGLASAQSFTYQGKLTVAGTPASGPYDLRFRLYDSDTGGPQQGGTAAADDVQVSNGIFTVELDFGPGAITPGQKWIEMEVRPGASTDTYNLLAPRQKITNAPYSTLADRAMTAGQADTANDANTVGGIAPSLFIQEGDARLTDARQPLAGSPSYVQISPGAPQSGGFDVLGNGKIGGSLTVLGSTFLNSNLSVGGTITGTVSTASNALNLGGVAANQFVQTGDARLSDARNPLPGSSNYIRNSSTAQTANFNVSGSGTVSGTLTASFVNASNYYSLNGTRFASISANNSSFYGNAAGDSNPGGTENTYIGFASQSLGIGGSFNSFIGSRSGLNNTGSNNFFGGYFSGWQNITGANNTFVGVLAGGTNSGGSSNTLVGSLANVGTGNLTNATAVGANSLVTQSNSVVIGATGVNVGIGTTAPKATLDVVGGNIRIALPGGVLLMVSPDGNCWGIRVLNGGILQAVGLTCP